MRTVPSPTLLTCRLYLPIGHQFSDVNGSLSVQGQRTSSDPGRSFGQSHENNELAKQEREKAIMIAYLTG